MTDNLRTYFENNNSNPTPELKKILDEIVTICNNSMVEFRNWDVHLFSGYFVSGCNLEFKDRMSLMKLHHGIRTPSSFIASIDSSMNSKSNGIITVNESLDLNPIMNKDKKLLNWQQLNQKVLCKFDGLQLTQRQIIEVVEC